MPFYLCLVLLKLETTSPGKEFNHYKSEYFIYLLVIVKELRQLSTMYLNYISKNEPRLAYFLLTIQRILTQNRADICYRKKVRSFLWTNIEFVR